MFASKDLFFSKPSGYQISRSVRLRSSASAYFNRTQTSGNRQLFTYSAWIKRGTLGGTSRILSVYNTGSNNQFLVQFATDIIAITGLDSGVSTLSLNTTQVFRDSSAWYHIILAVDTTQAIASNRIKLYVNGFQVTSFSTASYPAQNYNTWINFTGYVANISSYNGTAEFFDGYLTEINFIDGQALTPSSFGQTNTITGVWQPLKYTGTYGTNGFYLNFSDNSNNTATTIGKDYSGNGNNWTPNNISVTAGVTYDSMIDVPTLYADGGTGRGNYCTLNPIGGSTNTIQNGNLQLTGTAAGTSQRAGSMVVSSGKWYYEVTLTTLPAGMDPIIGFSEINNASLFSQNPGQASTSYAIYTISTNSFLQKVNNNTFTNTNTGVAAQGDVIGVALDLDNGKIWFSKNNTWVDSGVPSSGTNAQYTGITGTYAPAVRGTGGATTTTIDPNFGQRPFTYTPPTGFVALNTQNLPTPTISNGATVMAATLYTGNGSTQTITNTVNGISFQPDFVWAKQRNGVNSNAVFDSVRGVYKYLYTNAIDAEVSDSSTLTAFNSNGFSASSATNINGNTNTYVAWQWNAGGSTVTNTSGTISAQVRANATAGFSVVTYTGTGANATLGHGLGVAPKMVIVKRRDATADWSIWHTAIPAANYLVLNQTIASTSAPTVWNSTAPTSTVFSVGTSTNTNASAGTHVAYCFASVAGYSAFGSYTGNGSTDGPFVYCGFRPRWVMIKRTDTTGNWWIYDTSRSTYNAAIQYLFADTSGAEVTDTNEPVDFLANGFKLRVATFQPNTSGGTFIFMAFAENPFKNSLAR